MQRLLSWIDDRFPLTKLWEDQWGKYVAPKNFNFWYYFGSLAAFVLVMQIITGIFLAMNYKPDATKAFESIEYIMRDPDLRTVLNFQKVDGSTCTRCHTDSSPGLVPFVLSDKLPLIKHWKDHT